MTVRVVDTEMKVSKEISLSVPVDLPKCSLLTRRARVPLLTVPRFPHLPVPSGGQRRVGQSEITQPT